MKLKFFAFIFSCLIVFGCSANKDMNERRNYMIPQKDELPRNSKYSKAKKKTVNKTTTKKKKRKYKR